jgi:hypothetical protein
VRCSVAVVIGVAAAQVLDVIEHLFMHTICVHAALCLCTLLFVLSSQSPFVLHCRGCCVQVLDVIKHLFMHAICLTHCTLAAYSTVELTLFVCAALVAAAQVLDVIEHLFMHMFNGLATKYATELEAVQAQYPFEPIAAKPVRLTFAGASYCRQMVAECSLSEPWCLVQCCRTHQLVQGVQVGPFAHVHVCTHTCMIVSLRDRRCLWGTLPAETMVTSCLNLSPVAYTQPR